MVTQAQQARSLEQISLKIMAARQQGLHGKMNINWLSSFLLGLIWNVPLEVVEGEHDL